MFDAMKDFADLGSNYFRSLAGRQLPAVKAYGSALQDFADRKIDEVQFGKSLVNLGFKEYLRSAEDAVKFGFEFYSKLLSTTGVKVEETMGKFNDAAGGAKGKR